MKPIIKILILLFSGVITSCNMVDFPELVEQSPIFFAKGSIGEKSINWIAGQDDYFMHTNLKQSDRETILEGRLAKIECKELCPQSLQLTMVLDSSTLSSTPNIFREGNKQFFTTLERDRMQFLYSTKSENKGLPEASREVSIGEIEIIKEQLITVPKRISPFRYLVKYPGYLSILIETNINPRIEEMVLPTLKIDANEKRKLIALTGERILSVDWSNSKDGINAIELVNFPDSRLSAKVSLASGGFVSYTFDFGEFANSKTFSLNETVITNVNKIIAADNMSQNQTIVLEFMDENGTKYSSKSIEQSNSSFQFKLSEPYQSNELGNRTQKLNCAINCLLSNGDTGKLLKVQNLEMTIALPFQ